MSVRRKHRVEDVFDMAVADDERQPLEQAHAVEAEGWQAERFGELELGIAEEIERKRQALGRLALIFGVLCAQAEDRRAETCQLLEVVAESARLGRAASRPGDLVPALRGRAVGQPGPGIQIDDGPSRPQL